MGRVATGVWDALDGTEDIVSEFTSGKLKYVDCVRRLDNEVKMGVLATKLAIKGTCDVILTSFTYQCFLRVWDGLRDVGLKLWRLGKEYGAKALENMRKFFNKFSKDIGKLSADLAAKKKRVSAFGVRGGSAAIGGMVVSDTVGWGCIARRVFDLLEVGGAIMGLLSGFIAKEVYKWAIEIGALIMKALRLFGVGV